MKFFKDNWEILLGYVIFLVGIIIGWIYTLDCEGLGCLAGVVMGMLGLYAAGIYSIGVIVVQSFRGKMKLKYWWLVPLIVAALWIFAFTLVN